MRVQRRSVDAEEVDVFGDCTDSEGTCILRVSLISEGVSGLSGRVDHSEGVPPQVQVGERHLPGLIDTCHELRRLDRSFIGRRLLGM
jgi:hypothetical protein